MRRGKKTEKNILKILNAIYIIIASTVPFLSKQKDIE